MATGRKRGKLSTEEEKFIMASKDSLDVEQIAKHLNRTIEPILRYMAENASTMRNKEDGAGHLSNDAELRKKLKDRPYWSEVKQQFSSDELEYFVRSWIEFMKQFQENTLYSEELEVKNWITFEIIMNRSNKERKKAIDAIEEMTKFVVEEYKKPIEERSQKLEFYEQQLNFHKSTLASYTMELTKLQTQIKDIKKDLKAARSDRVRKFEEGKQTFPGLIRMLDDETLNEREGWNAAILSKAADKAKAEHAKMHQFLDDKFAQPFLNHETVLGDKNEQEE